MVKADGHFMEKVKYFRINPISLSLVTTIFFVTTSIYSMIMFPNYSISNDYLSLLGTKSSPVDILFNSSVSVTALLLALLFFSIHDYLREIIDYRVSILALFIGIGSSISLSLVATIPGNTETLTLHLITAYTFYLGISIYFLILTRTMNKMNSNLTALSVPIQYYAISFLIITVALLDIGTWYNKILQKVLVYTALIFMNFISIKVVSMADANAFRSQSSLQYFGNEVSKDSV